MSDRNRQVKYPNLPLLARRDVLMAGGAAAALGLVASGPVAASSIPSAAEVYAFRAPHGSDLVFAVAFPAGDEFDGRSALPAVRIHAGQEVWTVRRDGDLNGNWHHGDRTFVGRSLKTSPTAQNSYHLIVVSTRLPNLQSGNHGVWAEISDNLGARLRVGSPIMTEILSRTPSIARIFHRADPSIDRALFTEALEKQVFKKEPGAAEVDCSARSERLADLLLPDVLPFDAGQAAGFTFAGRNGRLPSDAVGNVVNSVLAGISTPRQTTPGVFRMSGSFPYFATETAA